jgi:MSHA biogenesis protein MshP
MMNRMPIARCRGFALMLAVFMIITLAAIGLYLITISSGQIQAVSQDVQAARAYQAAQTGINWGAYQLLRVSTCTASQTLTLTSAGLSGFYAQVTCQIVSAAAGETEGATTVKAYLITATGCNANPCSPATPAQTYVERQLQLTVTQ